MQLAQADDSADRNGGRRVSDDPKDQISQPSVMGFAVAKPEGNDETDATLVGRVGQGDPEALRTLVARHLSAVVVVARQLLGDASEAEDIGQETFLRLWRSAKSLEIGGPGARPWLRRVARNLALDRLRATRRLEVVDEVPEHHEAPSQVAKLEDQERAQRVANVLATLPDRQRVALTLFHFEDLSQVEIANEINASVDAVESLLARARRRLKKELENEWRELLAEADLEV